MLMRFVTVDAVEDPMPQQTLFVIPQKALALV